MRSAPDAFAWRALPRATQLYVATVIFLGACVLTTVFPFTYPDPVLFAFVLVAACVASVWKITLPILVAGESTLSVAYAADLMALLLVGPSHAVIVSVAGAWTQCTFNVRWSYPLYRTVFSMGAKAITMATAGLAYSWLAGPSVLFELSTLTRPVVGTIAVYFVVNTGLVAGAIALSTHQKIWNVWRDDFLWSASSFMVGGSAGAIAGMVIHRGEHWKALVLLAPVYLTYRAYNIFAGRLELQKQHERALAEEKERERAARASAEEANRLKDEFLAMVSHELRTPLSAILGWADMLRSGKLENSRRERAQQVIYESAVRQAQMIDELLDVSRIVSGKLRVNYTAVDLADVVRDGLAVVQFAAKAKRIRITTDLDRSLGPIQGDSARLQQVVSNLLTNAVKFTPNDGAVHVRLLRAGRDAELVVADNGPGIAAGFLPSIFEPFRQADASTTRQHGGLGLGLAIVKHLVEAHGGVVTADNNSEGPGAAFTVRLPIVPAAADPSQAMISSATAEPTQILDGMSVLLVDDDEAIRQVVSAYLENQRAVVLTAASCPQALELLQRAHVDVLLADIAMPGEDGYALVRQVRASSTHRIASMPAVALTALAREEDRQQALKAGFQFHLTKPIDGRSLVAAIASVRPKAISSGHAP